MSAFPEVRELELAVLEPEMLADPNNPLNDPYYESLHRARQLVVGLSAQLRPKHVRIAKLAHTGMAPAEIAQEVNLTPATVRNVLKGPASRLITALRYTAALVDGPNLSLRKNMLWRIAHRAELEEPSISITALRELNKLEGAYPAPAPPSSPNVNITINAEALPRTALDGDAEHE